MVLTKLITGEQKGLLIGLLIICKKLNWIFVLSLSGIWQAEVLVPLIKNKKQTWPFWPSSDLSYTLVFLRLEGHLLNKQMWKSNLFFQRRIIKFAQRYIAVKLHTDPITAIWFSLWHKEISSCIQQLITYVQQIITVIT